MCNVDDMDCSRQEVRMNFKVCFLNLICIFNTGVGRKGMFSPVATLESLD